jgi:hypothetical protein
MSDHIEDIIDKGLWLRYRDDAGNCVSVHLYRKDARLDVDDTNDYAPIFQDAMLKGLEKMKE